MYRGAFKFYYLLGGCPVVLFRVFLGGVSCRESCSCSNPFLVYFAEVLVSATDVIIGDTEGVGGIITALPTSVSRVTTLANDES